MPTQSAEKLLSPDAGAAPAQALCRFCSAPLAHVFVDLGASPLANSYLTADQTREAEAFFPLKPHVCGHCFLVQLPVMETPDRIFTDYAYFSSFTDSWVRHAKAYTETVVERFNLGRASSVVEIASNDGYLLQHFVAQRYSGTGHRACGERRGCRGEEGDPDESRLFRHGPGPRAGIDNVAPI